MGFEGGIEERPEEKAGRSVARTPGR